MEASQFSTSRVLTSYTEEQETENNFKQRPMSFSVSKFSRVPIQVLSPNVMPVANMADFFNYINNNLSFNSLVVFDIDKVLLHRVISNYISKKRVVFPPVADAVNLLSHHADVVCITSRYQKNTVNFYKKGIDLCHKGNKIELTDTQTQELQQNNIMFLDNIFYTNRERKFTSLSLFYNWSKTKYSSIFFIDDQMLNSLDIASFGKKNKLKLHSCLLKNPEDDSDFSFEVDHIAIKSTPFFYKDDIFLDENRGAYMLQ